MVSAIFARHFLAEPSRHRDGVRLVTGLMYTLQVEQLVRMWACTGDAVGVNLESKLDVHCGTDIHALSQGPSTDCRA